MLAGGAFVALGLFPAYATGQLMTTDAKCLLGYEWTFNTLNQSPCDVAASLAAVCSPNGYFNLEPLPSGYVYSGPRTEFATSCRCSTVYYSMLSACGYCQARNFINWSLYRTNCSTVSVQSFNQPLPAGVKVPAWAYLNVLEGDTFNITLAQQTGGTESSRLPVMGTPSISTSSVTWSRPPATLTVLPKGSHTSVGAIAGGVAGGVIFITISLVTIGLFCRRRSFSTTSSNHQSTSLATRSNMISPDSFPQTSGRNNFDGGPADSLLWLQQSTPSPSITAHSPRQTVHPEMTAQTQSVTPPTQYTMITPHSTNTALTPQNTNTAPLVPLRRNTSTFSTFSTQNLTQNMVSTLPGQSSVQNVNVVSMPPSQDMRQNTMPLAQGVPWSPPQYTVDPF